MSERFERSKMLFGANFDKLQKAKILVCGCGGVGGACIEALYRSGAVNLSIIDNDIFEITNQNRQLESENLGEKKVVAFSKKFSAIKPIDARIDDKFIQNFDFSKFDVIIDAIDEINAKIALVAKICEIKKTKKIYFISSMGAAKRIDPLQIKFGKIFNTSHDAFAKKMRNLLKSKQIYENFDVVFSQEEPKCQNLGSFMGVTATFGLFIASKVIEKICD